MPLSCYARCTNGTVADTLVVYAKTKPDAGPHGITTFLIKKGMKVRKQARPWKAAGRGAQGWGRNRGPGVGAGQGQYQLTCCGAGALSTVGHLVFC